MICICNLQELQSAQGGTSDTSVILSMNNNRDLSLDGILRDVKKQYEAVAERKIGRAHV